MAGFSNHGVANGWGGVGSGYVLAQRALRGDDGLAVVGLVGCVAVAGGSVMGAAGAAIDDWETFSKSRHKM